MKRPLHSRASRVARVRRRQAAWQRLCLAVAAAIAASALAGTALQRNMPGVCSQPKGECDCQRKQVSANCIKVEIGLGETTPWTGSMPCALKVFADDDSPSVFTVESLYAVLGGYTFKRLGQRNMSDGATPAEVVFSHPRGEPVRFVFGEGESLGRPDPGVHVKMDERLMMVDAEGWAVTSNPVYYDLYTGDGTRRRFLATNATGALGKLVSVTDARGVTVTPADMGVDVVYDSNGVRQFLTPSRLANVTPTADFSGYDVVVYALQEPPARDSATGLYALPASRPVERVSVRGENGGKRVVVTTQSGDADPLRHVFDYAMGDWSLTRPSGVEERKERYIDDERAAQVVHTTVSASGAVIERTKHNYKWEPWGFAMTNRVDGFGGVTDTTEWTYHASGNGRGQVKTERRQSGLLVQYAYDNADRVVSETRSGPGMMTEATTYSYTPVDPSDPVLTVDTRPRTVVKTLGSVECERTYYVYSPLTNIVERVGTQGAPYGGTNALRTVTAFYPVVVGAAAPAARSGRIASIRHEDGRLDLYDYALVSNLWTETVTHLHEQSPAPVSGKTTRDVTLTNARGEVAETRTEAYIDGAWHVIAQERRTYNLEGRVVRRENLAGQVTTTEWDCCHKITETQPDGSTTTWDYDAEGRMVASSRLIPLDMTNVTWLTTCYAYDDLGRQVATWQTNYAAQVGLPATRASYDQLGRVASRINALGNTTTTTYSPDGRTVSVQNPNTSTRVITRSAEGDTLSITGTAVTPEFHTYGIQPDGTRWSRTVQGETASSPRFTKRYENMLGQTVREERSGFQGAVLATTHAYDSYGRLVRTSPDYEPTVEYAYDVLGNRIATTHTTGGPSVQWRRTSPYSAFAMFGGDVWLVQTNFVSCSGALMPQTTSALRQLTGLAAATPARSVEVDVRGNATETWLSADGSRMTNFQRVPYATNKPLSVSRYGFSVMDVSVSAVTNTYAYDALGRQIAHADGRGNTSSTEYNAFGQRSASIDALGNRTIYAYDRFGNLAAVTNPLGNAIVYEYDLRGRKTYEGGATYPVRYTYDVFGNKTTMMTYRNESLGPDSGDVTTWLYDEASGCMTNKVYADGVNVAFRFSSLGQVVGITRENGVMWQKRYDDWGLVTNLEYSSDYNVYMLYDGMGRLVERHGNGIELYLMDMYGNVTNELSRGLGGSYNICYKYDAFGRRVSSAFNGKKLWDVKYDLTTGRIASMWFNDNAMSIDVHYLPGSDLRSALDYSNGFRTDFFYGCAHSRPTIVSNDVCASFHYVYDSMGRCVECNGVQYEYNFRGELIRARDNTRSLLHEFEYDDAGNRVSSSLNGNMKRYLVNNLNQCTNVFCDGLASPILYDVCGNVTNLETTTGRWSISYDNCNEPFSWKRDDGASYLCLYDNMGRRALVKYSVGFESRMFQRIAYADFHAVARCIYNTRLYLFDKPYDRHYFWAPPEFDEHQLFCLFDSTVSNQYTCVSDLQKNIMGYIDKDGVVDRNSFLPFGMPQQSANGQQDIMFMWQTEEFDAVLGLIHYNFRYYDPHIGRWLSRDPLGEKASLNLYCFLGNDPVNKRDYLGLVDNAQCDKQVEEALSSVEFRDIKKAFAHFRCEEPPVRCKCCKEKRKIDGTVGIIGGYYKPRSWYFFGNTITICSNAHDGMPGYRSIKSSLFHEYLHALQSCRGEFF